MDDRGFYGDLVFDPRAHRRFEMSPSFGVLDLWAWRKDPSHPREDEVRLVSR